MGPDIMDCKNLCRFLSLWISITHTIKSLLTLRITKLYYLAAEFWLNNIQSNHPFVGSLLFGKNKYQLIFCDKRRKPKCH